MITIELTLPGTPVAKGRPRFTSTGRTYTPAKTRLAEQQLLAHWISIAGKREPHAGAVEVELTAVFEPAKSWPKGKRAAALAGELEHTGRPDVDNLLKIIDGLNGVAWHDDSQIKRATVSKCYGEQACTLITIHLLNPTT